MNHRFVLLLLFSAGCGPLSTEPMPDIPETVDYDTVRIEYGDDDLLLASGSAQALVGDPSGLSTIAQVYLRGTNRIIRTNIQLIEYVTRQVPTSYAEGVWTWDNRDYRDRRSADERPSRFQIREIQAGEYEYRWEVGATDDTLEEVFSGMFRPSVELDGRQQGEGILRFEFGAMARQGLSSDPLSGRGVIAFRSVGGIRQVRAAMFDVVTPSAPDPASTSYQYVQHPDGRGRFKFATESNFLKDGEPLELIAIDAVWLADRTGRAEASLTGGSLIVNEVLLEECWDDVSATTFANATPDLGTEYEDGTRDACATSLAEVELSPPALGPPADPQVPEPHPDER